ncbi:hypothetical protein TC41_0902 [Alicyclobacillus acidocaldarius subsp. acidocaldarius Tc-4-1]|uniref:Uncharacterized protein n=1 Tax=Alicyclobacillus acidocaldarius (strain Tc-4-1) TaxID=1048834 RepID=F8IFF3_ALIAT|nr:hypothetical protein TC41_0902 [Alicyclobacillus acidocaldarius subsp. acidocaldarius Tc-4-1]
MSAVILHLLMLAARDSVLLILDVFAACLLAFFAFSGVVEGPFSFLANGLVFVAAAAIPELMGLSCLWLMKSGYALSVSIVAEIVVLILAAFVGQAGLQANGVRKKHRPRDEE